MTLNAIHSIAQHCQWKYLNVTPPASLSVDFLSSGNKRLNWNQCSNKIIIGIISNMKWSLMLSSHKIQIFYWSHGLMGFISNWIRKIDFDLFQIYKLRCDMFHFVERRRRITETSTLLSVDDDFVRWNYFHIINISLFLMTAKTKRIADGVTLCCAHMSTFAVLILGGWWHTALLRWWLPCHAMTVHSIPLHSIR